MRYEAAQACRLCSDNRPVRRGTGISTTTARGAIWFSMGNVRRTGSRAGDRVKVGTLDQEVTYLSFGFDDKLWRIAALSRSFDSDPHGNKVLSRYTELSELLAEKYGKGKRVHSLGDSIYSQSQYFIAGINGGRTNWFTDFDPPNLHIQIGIAAAASDSAK
jgi:hypothetical protein